MLCPICKKTVQITDPFMPFCSDRCRIQDLANWSDEKYVVSGSADVEEGENLPGLEDEDD
ncbi:MAG: DNA gyrase inhibitor YacG [Acidobacteriota bacterium]